MRKDEQAQENINKRAQTKKKNLEIGLEMLEDLPDKNS